MRIFFGAGTIGQWALEIWQGCNISVDYICDNEEKRWGETLCGVEIVAIKSLYEAHPDLVCYITCRETEEIVNQLLQMGMTKEQIRLCNTLVRIAYYAMEQPEWSLDIQAKDGGDEEVQVLFDLSYGLALGGVETWCIRERGRIHAMGYSGALLVDPNRNPQQKEDSKWIEPYCLDDYPNDWERIYELIQIFARKKERTVICNFSTYTFVAACLWKKANPQAFRLVAVVHNDEDCYYQDYGQMETYLNHCLYISQKIKEGLLEKGFSNEKIHYLPWEIQLEKKWDRTYSKDGQPLSIGYAGRIVQKQKRMDLLLRLIEGLEEKNISYQFELAGEGVFRKELEENIARIHLEEKVHFLGLIPREEMGSFWRRQDIMISCSDYEGHSITQVEAIAQGAVPVLTDTSGVRDDVCQGVTGFIVEPGDVEKMVEYVNFLYEQRNQIEDIGRRGRKKLGENDSTIRIRQLWTRLLAR